jgi:malonyl-ACP decarboxylase
MTVPCPVVVTGMGVLCSVASEVPGFAAALRAGRTGIAATGGPAPFAALLRDSAPAESMAGRAGLPEGLRRAAQRIACRSPLPVRAATAVALQAWEQAQLHEAPVTPGRLGVVVAGSNLTGRYAWDLRHTFEGNPAHLPPRFALQFQDTDHVGVLSHVLGITGEGCTVGGASASGNIGIVSGSRLVELGAVDACLVVGALVDLSPMEMHAFLNVGAMAGPARPEERALPGAPFDQSHRGFVYGQGSACLVLESERSALARGAAILAELAGYSVGLDANSLANPDEEGQVRVIAGAIARAGLRSEDVAYVSAHGTASPLGDETEARALRRVFGASSPAGPRVNATKSVTGHCLAAAGVIEAVAAVIQLRDGFLHPNVGLERPIDTDHRFVGQRPEPFDGGAALSASYGFGGVNTAVVLAGR